ncbi:MAG: FkbM family methyltransferase [Bacteroidota bacterium]
MGANLGYFTVPLSRLVGEQGHVYAIEPVSVFRAVLRTNVQRFGVPERVAVLPVALGREDGGTVTLETAEVDGVARHGMTRVVGGTQAPGSALVHEAPVRRPDTLLAHLDRLDFLKVDIEGYETEVMPLFAPLVARHRPAIEVEAGSPDSTAMLRALFEPLGYVACTLHENGLVPLDDAARRGLSADAEVYFWPSARRL